MGAETGKLGHEGEPIVPPQLAVIIMGSGSDKPHADKIVSVLDAFGVAHVLRVGSAHKTPEHVLDILRSYDPIVTKDVKKQIVIITVAGGSNALGGFTAGNTGFPVIQSPPKGESTDIYSSLRLPSGISAPVVIEPEAAALHAVEIFALSNPELAEKFREFQAEMKHKNYEDDRILQE